MTDTTNAGPVLPEYHRCTGDEMRCIDGKGCECALAGNPPPSLHEWGLQCWNACEEHVAGPLRERVAELERKSEGLRQQHDRDSKELRALCEQRDEYIVRSRQLQADKRALLQGSEEQRSEIDRLRAENEAKDKRITELQSMLKAARAAREG